MIRQAPLGLQKLIEPAVTVLGYELVGIEYLPQGRHSLLRIYIDAPDGVTVDDCQRVSHQVDGLLDVEDPISGQYSLEVSSPGADRLLFNVEHFIRFTGRRIKLRLDSLLEGRRNFTGVLQGVQDGNVLLEEDGKLVSLSMDKIEVARLVPEFD